MIKSLVVWRLYQSTPCSNLLFSYGVPKQWRIQGVRGLKPPQICCPCQFEHSYGPAFSKTLTPPSRMPGSSPAKCYVSLRSKTGTYASQPRGATWCFIHITADQIKHEHVNVSTNLITDKDVAPYTHLVRTRHCLTYQLAIAHDK